MVKHMHSCRTQAYWKCKRCQHGAGSGVPHTREDGCRFKPVPGPGASPAAAPQAAAEQVGEPAPPPAP
eukprot:5071972-Pyramimonas_sp.AAC.1